MMENHTFLHFCCGKTSVFSHTVRSSSTEVNHAERPLGLGDGNAAHDKIQQMVLFQDGIVLFQLSPHPPSPQRRKFLSGGLPALNEIPIRLKKKFNHLSIHIQMREKEQERERVAEGLMQVRWQLPPGAAGVFSHVIRVGVPAEFSTVLHERP